MKTCPVCKQTKSKSDFYPKNGKTDWCCKECAKAARRKERIEKPERLRERRKSYYQRHKAEIVARQKEYRKAYPEKQKESDRKWRLKNATKMRYDMVRYYYGITPDQYEEVVRRQLGCCAICGAENSGKRRLHVDHDHKTGKFRGLLCSRCNSGIGMFRERELLMRRAIAYLRLHKANRKPEAITSQMKLFG